MHKKGCHMIYFRFIHRIQALTSDPSKTKAFSNYPYKDRAKLLLIQSRIEPICEPKVSPLLIHHGPSQFVNPQFHRYLSTQGSRQMYACTTHQDNICKLRIFTKPQLSKHITIIQLMWIIHHLHNIMFQQQQALHVAYTYHHT